MKNFQNPPLTEEQITEMVKKLDTVDLLIYNITLNEFNNTYIPSNIKKNMQVVPVQDIKIDDTYRK